MEQTEQEPKQPNHYIRPFMAQHYRNVCRCVIDAYHTLKSIVPGAGAINYETVLSGQSSAMYGDHELSMSGINFVADVENLCKTSLTPIQLSYFKSMILDTYPDYDRQSILFRTLTAKMGKVFKENKLYPVGKYSNR